MPRPLDGRRIATHGTSAQRSYHSPAISALTHILVTLLGTYTPSMTTPTTGTTTTTTLTIPSTSANMAGSAEIDDDNAILPTIDDISEEDRAEIEVKTTELHALMLGRYMKTHAGFVKRTPDLPSISMNKVTPPSPTPFPIDIE
ncbi:hypothetical protein GUJ93_ZPchr0013g33851 [Zizania palustris]|uniref:Uncharacterized protein n=1 Tax=Zizania palustris TaxID=103762 RepID=A0A8J5X533_ZIZPA|nr:hypothetical protein GUJ93_ZPchr0013g33851 [Zizania palustris]